MADLASRSIQRLLLFFLLVVGVFLSLITIYNEPTSVPRERQLTYAILNTLVFIVILLLSILLLKWGIIDSPEFKSLATRRLYILLRSLGFTLSQEQLALMEGREFVFSQRISLAEYEKHRRENSLMEVNRLMNSQAFRDYERRKLANEISDVQISSEEEISSGEGENPK